MSHAHRRLRNRAFILLFLWSLTGTPDAWAQARRVLLLHSLERGTLTLDDLSGQFRADLDRLAGETVRFTQLVVSPSGFDVMPETAIVEFLHAALADHPPPNLVVTIGGPAAAFARRHRAAIFPEVPLLLVGVDQRFLQDAPLRGDETAVAVANDMTGLVDGILDLLPGTSTLFVVVGSGPLGAFWRGELEREFRPFARRLRLAWSNDMSYSELLRALSSLPPNSAILHITFGTDARGADYSEERFLADVHAVANAPLFASQGPQMGHGIVGGRLMRTDELGRTAAEIALRLLNGGPSSSIDTPVQRPGRPIFDWRELDRWGISTRRLPPDSVIQFQPPGVWERFKWGILGGVSILLAQAVLITALLASRVRRQRAEQSLRESERRFRVLADSAPVMIWTADADGGRTDFNRSWLAFTGRTAEEERGDGWQHGLHPDDVPPVVQAVRRAWNRREPFQLEYRLRRFDGEDRWVLSVGVPRFTSGDRFSGYIGSVLDVTDLKAARAALANFAHRLIGAHEEERTRIARELHDDVGQRMALLVIDLEQLRVALPDTAARGLVANLNEAVSTLSKDIQSISHRLHSSKLEILGLAAAAGSFCREVAAKQKVAIEYAHHDLPVHLPDAVALNVFRVLQEALSNAIKHSSAEHYRVELRVTNGRLILEVSDDGCGFDVAEAFRGHGLGLLSMQERLRLVHGDVTVDSTPGAGTTVRATVPLPEGRVDAPGAVGASQAVEVPSSGHPSFEDESA